MERKLVCPHCLASLTGTPAACPVCGQHFSGVNPAGSLPYGTLLGGRYTIGKYILADGEGLLYHAVENNSTVQVVIKEYFPVTLSAARCPDGHIEPKEGSEVLFKTNRMDFADLYRAIMRITPAAGLAAVLDVIEENGTAYAVQETVQGMPLERYLSMRGGSLSVTEAAELMQPVLEGVAALHKAGLIHRGIAPDNIFISEGGAGRLAGYATLGLRTAGSELKAQLYEGYSAPEQYSAAEFEGRYTDVYGLGAVFYRILTGVTPMSAAQRKVADSQHSVRGMQSAVPPYLSDLLAAAMRLDPAERIQNVPELMGGLHSQDETNAAIKRGNKRGRKKVEVQPRTLLTGLTGSLVVILILFALLAWLLLGQRGEEQPESQSVPESVSQAVELLPVPDFAGMTFDQVERSSEFTANFSFALYEEYNAEIPRETVIRQEPAAGSRLGPDDSHLIRLYISKGLVMPNIIGFTRENASSELTSQGIPFTIEELPNEGQYVSDGVVRTSVGAGDSWDITQEPVRVYIAGEETPPESGEESHEE